MMKAYINLSHPTRVTLQGKALTIADVLAVARSYASVELGQEAISRIQAARHIVDRIIDDEKAVYGVTTGIGYLSRVRIPPQQVTELQRNLLYSHAAAVGEPLS